MRALALVAVMACGEGAAPSDARLDPPIADAAAPRTYKQVEVLARPAIAEALLATDSALAAYNRAGPAFAGVDTTLVETRAKTVLKSLYLGACLLNGVLGVPAPAAGVKPAGVPCQEI